MMYTALVMLTVEFPSSRMGSDGYVHELKTPPKRGGGLDAADGLRSRKKNLRVAIECWL